MAFAGVLLSLAVAVALGMWIPRLVRLHLLEARAELFGSMGDEIASRSLVPVGPPGSDSYTKFSQEVALSLIGGETVRVKLWTLDGTVSFSDDPTLVGQHFGLSPAAEAALAGRTTFNISDLSEPAHAHERSLGRLMEFYVPVHDSAGETVGLFEVEQRVDALNATLAHVERGVWLAIGSGLGLLGIFMGVLTVRSGRVLNQRRLQAEGLLGSLVRVQEEERRRTVGALHDDVGQPLYRLLYGLEGSRAKLPAEHPVRAELDRLVDLTREIDRTLRTELRMLHKGDQDELGLETALEGIVEIARTEANLRIHLDFDGKGHWDIDPLAKTALVHAVSEAVTNVRKHAHATEVRIKVERANREVVAAVEDDGTGIRSPEGLGIVATRERLEASGGKLHITSHPGKGTQVRASVPTRESAE